jgi:hypothetical protein
MKSILVTTCQPTEGLGSTSTQAELFLSLLKKDLKIWIIVQSSENNSSYLHQLRLKEHFQLLASSLQSLEIG